MSTHKYGTKEWFEYMFSDALGGVDGWGHQRRASQKYRYKLSLSVIEPVISQQYPQSILDIGCGLGDFSNLVYVVNPKNSIYGMDISENAIMGAQRKYRHIKFRTAALPDIAYMKQFDGIIALDCIYYLSEDDRIHATKNIFDHLNPKGWFLFSSPLDSGNKYFSEQGAIGLLARVGFRSQAVYFNHAKIFRKFERPLIRILDLDRKIAEICLNPPDQFTQKKRLVFNLIQTPLLGYALKNIVSFSKSLSDRVLESNTIVEFFQTFCGLFLKEFSKSHIIILAKKDA